MATAKGSNWCFFSSHGLVLISIARDPYLRLTEIAAQVGLTPRAVQTVLRDLEQAGVLERFKEGRRNRYQVRLDLALRHPMVADQLITDAFGKLVGEPATPAGVLVGAGRDG